MFLLCLFKIYFCLLIQCTFLLKSAANLKILGGKNLVPSSSELQLDGKMESYVIKRILACKGSGEVTLFHEWQALHLPFLF